MSMDPTPVKLFEAEYRFALLVWENEPVGSGELARLAQEKLGWKRTTAYTVLKKLCDRGVLQNENATVTALIPWEEIQHQESRSFLSRMFDGSLPRFIAAFMGDRRLTPQEAEQLKTLIDRYQADPPKEE